MKKIYCVAMLVLMRITAGAQFTEQAGSAFPDIKEACRYNVLMTDDSTTFVTIFTPREGLSLKIYRPGDGGKSVPVDVDYGRLTDRMNDVYAFNINNQLVLFILGTEDRKPALHRLVIDRDGKLLQSDVIARLKYLDVTHGYTINIKEARAFTAYYVKKETDGNNYAVAVFNGASDNPAERVEIIHFNSAHKEINRGFAPPTPEYNYSAYLEMAVDGDRKVGLTFMGVKTKVMRHSMQGRALYFGQLQAGKPFELNEIESPGPGNVSEAMMQYNKTQNRWDIMCAEYYINTSGYKTYAGMITPAEGAAPAVSWKMLGHTAEQGLRLPVAAMPQELYINADGSHLVLLQDWGESNQMSSMSISGSTHSFSRSHTMLGNLKLRHYGTDGVLLHETVIPNKQFFDFAWQSPMEHYEDMFTIQYAGRTPVFTDIAWLKRAGGGYLLLNMPPAGKDRNRQDMVKEKDMKESEAYYVRMDDTAGPVKKMPVFPSRDVHEGGIWRLSCYNPTAGLLAVITRNHATEHYRLVWLKPE